MSKPTAPRFPGSTKADKPMRQRISSEERYFSHDPKSLESVIIDNVGVGSEKGGKILINDEAVKKMLPTRRKRTAKERFPEQHVQRKRQERVSTAIAQPEDEMETYLTSFKARSLLSSIDAHEESIDSKLQAIERKLRSL